MRTDQVQAKVRKVTLWLNHIIDPYHLAAVLNLRGIKSFVFARQASARREFSARLAVQKQSFLFS